MEVVGKIIQVLPLQEGVGRNGNPWKLQGYVLETLDQYPRKVHFEVFGEDRIKQFNIQQGEDLTVQFDIDAHEFNGRWFNDIRAYNVIRGQQPAAAPSASPFPPAGATAPFPPAQEPAPAENSTDDLPF